MRSFFIIPMPSFVLIRHLGMGAVMSEKTFSKRRESFLRNFISGFATHPASVNETYLQHAGFALRLAASLFAAALAVLVHAFFPPLFETTASQLIRRMHARIDNRH
jgi:hypothetical protein